MEYVPCEMCLDNPASSPHPCEYDRKKTCNCCPECSRACWDDWHKDISEGEDEDLIRFWNKQ